MLRMDGLNELSEDTLEAKDVKIYYLDTLVLYLLGNRIGVKKAREYRNLRAAKEWHDWAVRFMNSKRRRIARLVRILGKNSLDDVFGCLFCVH